MCGLVIVFIPLVPIFYMAGWSFTQAAKQILEDWW